jgi:hypothetical protein
MISISANSRICLQWHLDILQPDLVAEGGWASQPVIP